MGVIAWLALGLIAGFVAARIVHKTGEGFVFDILLGALGAFVGGFLFDRIAGAAGIAGINPVGMLVAAGT